VFSKGVLEDIEIEGFKEIPEKLFTFLIRFTDDDGTMPGKILEVGKGWPEHRVGGNKPPSRFGVELL